MRQKILNLKNWFLFFLELQLLISIVMLPILIAWGLPISVMTIVGNLIFAQFLTVFILVSALLFTCDFLGIPNYYIVITLDWIAHVWHYFLSFGSAHWLIGFSTKMLPFACLAAAAACSMYIMQKYTQNMRILFLIGLCVIFLSTDQFFKHQTIHTTVLQGKQKFYIIRNKGKIYAFDCGALGARPSSQSWIEYTLASSMIQAMGATHIDVLFLCKSNSRTKSAAQMLTEHMPVSYMHTIKKNHKIISI